ncbi:HECT-domain-containing protein [Exidia glandulosa HHB12029]|uniref:HECT-type E3 ubiquitin transferase n=1 Tax=Exidia glandulosa HHB12029 TaxID=1314781 RepID=A0A165ISU7_EXIGL|nr:HECT-domain-containing protein [Exidia glandulosa HHB12029]
MFGFGNEGRKRMNLGGVSSAASHTAILDQAKARREERQSAKRQLDSAIMLQTWWRATSARAIVRRDLQAAFDAGSHADSVHWTRCLVFGGVSDERLAKWSTVMSQDNFALLIQPFAGPQRDSWLVLVRRVSMMLVQSVSRAPESQHSAAHFPVLNVLLSAPEMQKLLPDVGQTVSKSVTDYMCARAFVALIAAAFTRIPPTRKSPSLGPLALLSTRPFSSYAPGSQEYATLQSQYLQNVMTLPLLPNRIPIASLGTFSASLPLTSLESVDAVALVNSLEPLARVHLLANLATFVPASTYPSRSPATLAAYLSLLNLLVASLPAASLEPPTASKPTSSGDVDSDDEYTAPAEVGGTLLRLLDNKTSARVNGLVGPAHLSALLKLASNGVSVVHGLLANACALWPASRSRILGAAVAQGGAPLVKGLWRDWVRGSPIGLEPDPRLLTDPAHAPHWPSFLFLLQIYAQMLLTMGDEEFFVTLATPNAPRNPLTLDEVSALTKKALNVAFVLYWHEDQAGVKDGLVPGLSMRWEGVRADATHFLQSIHARDSRRPFMPPDYWLLTSQIDVTSFIEAAVLEDIQLTAPDDETQRQYTGALSKRQIAFVSPRLGVLHNIPFALPFEIRVAIFRHFVRNDMMRLGIDPHGMSHRRHKTVIRRDRIAEDGFDQLNDLGPALKGTLSITFVDQFGREEAGIDGGGVFKEFLTALSKEVFNADRGLWMTTSQHELYPSSTSYATEPHHLNWYRFIGRILGKALYQGILVEVAFASFFLAKWLEKQSFLDDLASLDRELYNGLIFLKHYQGNPEDLSLNFSVNEDDLGVTRTINLIPNGVNIPVTRENRLQYIHLVCHHRLTRQIRKQSVAFFEGLSEIIDQKWLRMFNQQELQILVAGVNAEVDVDDLRQHTNYGGVYDDNEETITAFWKVVKSFDASQRRQLLRFVTSCSRPPLLGFKELVPLFSIRDAGNDELRLPTASTCVNLLKLPRYKSEHILRQKLLQAISSNAGFDLS